MKFPRVDTLKDRMALLALGGKKVAGQWREKGFSMEEAIVAGKGAMRFANALRSGQVVTQAEYEEGVKICLQCPDMTRSTVDGDAGQSNWCGPALKPHTDEDGKLRTCGCLVLLKRACATADGLCPQDKNPLTIGGVPVEEFKRLHGEQDA